MARRRATAPEHTTPPNGNRLEQVVPAENGRTVSRVGTSEAEKAPLSAGAKAALGAIGAWADMDWDETLAELDRIRHESTPTPPIDEP